jgi:hypothetical protein
MSNYTRSGLPTIRLATSFNLSGAEVKRILYTKPDRTTGFWTATADGTDLTYNLTNTDIDVAGDWKLQAYVEVSGEKGYGEITRINFKIPIV